MPSQSIQLLEQRLAEVDCLIGIYQSRKARKSKNIGVEEPALMRGSLVVFCSHIEGYFEELIGEILETFDTKLATPSDFPEAIRIQQVVGDASKWTVQSTTKIWANVRTCAASPLFIDQAQHTPGYLDVDLHTNKFSNPGTSEITNLFKTIGINDVWAEFAMIEPQSAYKSEIDAIVSRRNQVAHGNMNSTIPVADLLSYMTNFRHTASVFDVLTSNYVATRVPGFVWPV